MLYLIPTPLGDMSPELVLPQTTLERLLSLDAFVVEELRSARRFLSKVGFKGRVDALHLEELNEHSTPRDVERCLHLLLHGPSGTAEGYDVGLISEAGLPAVADPGADLVALAHKHGIPVCPLVGPSSLMLALMSSGLNGQCFAFHGYLPVKEEERKKTLQALETRSFRGHESELFIETPYRNVALFKTMMEVLKPTTRLCVAASLTCPDAFICTDTVLGWKRRMGVAAFEKKPCVFIILAS